MQLRDRGLLTLDDPVVKYVPELRQVHNPFGEMSQITIRHLLSHSAGFRAGDVAVGRRQALASVRADALGAARRDDALHRDPVRAGQQVQLLESRHRSFSAGSSSGCRAKTTRCTSTKNMLTPLGMRRTFFDRAPYHLLQHRSHSYTLTDEGLNEARFDFDTGITVSNGGLERAARRHGEIPRVSDGRRRAMRRRHDVVLKRASLEEMFTPQIRASDGEGGSGGDVWAGLSCFIERHRRRRARRPQRRPERLHLASLLSPSIALWLRRVVQHQHDVEIEAAPGHTGGR